MRQSINGWYEYRSIVRGVLRGFGFSEEEFDIKIHILSGGQKTRLALAKLLLSEPDIMLLDEPTNHLDLPSIEELENALKKYHGAILYISHDSYFSNKLGGETVTVNKMFKP